jgi:hypothetical protein
LGQSKRALENLFSCSFGRAPFLGKKGKQITSEVQQESGLAGERESDEVMWRIILPRRVLALHVVTKEDIL